MVELIETVEVQVVRSNLERVREGIVRAGRDPEEVEILAAVKYLPEEGLGALKQAGIELLGENRAQELRRKADAYPGAFTWDFIGALQSRKVRDLLPYVRYIHSVASDSALAQLDRHGTDETKVLVEVNISGEEGKNGVAPAELQAFLDRCPVSVVGLMTMPPLTDDPERSRPHFAALRELAGRHGLSQLSMGTSQDYLVAVQEGATILRLGTTLYRRS
ncbi:MAG TPA: YggS family pyridoxal phosphate enzyme [Solirubrobacteraceae bacterium]|nr:YggS family pyridoxal phosphate enzyme [Solirubrobacteraceae bacterium]